jgi:hypothetical protein
VVVHSHRAMRYSTLSAVAAAALAVAAALRKKGLAVESVAINAQMQRMLGIANLGSVFGPGD